MRFEKPSQPSERSVLSSEIDALIERVVEHTLARLTSNNLQNPFISSKQCARLLGVTPEHLCAMRARGEGPSWTGDGRWTRYDRAAVLKWLAALPRSRSISGERVYPESSQPSAVSKEESYQTAADAVEECSHE